MDQVQESGLHSSGDYSVLPEIENFSDSGQYFGLRES